MVDLIKIEKLFLCSIHRIPFGDLCIDWLKQDLLEEAGGIGRKDMKQEVLEEARSFGRRRGIGELEEARGIGVLEEAVLEEAGYEAGIWKNEDD